MIRVVIADDHPLVRDGIAAILSRSEGVEVVGEAASGRELVAVAERQNPDVVLTDLRMPDGDGPNAITQLRQRGSRARVLVLTTYDAEGDVRSALAAGADGYLLKDAPRAELVRAVQEVAAGRAVLDPAVLRLLAGGPGEQAVAELTAREVEVLRQLAQGGPNRVAAARMHVSEATFKTHLRHIYDKLGVADRAAAVRVAYEQGLL